MIVAHIFGSLTVEASKSSLSKWMSCTSSITLCIMGDSNNLRETRSPGRDPWVAEGHALTTLHAHGVKVPCERLCSIPG